MKTFAALCLIFLFTEGVGSGQELTKRGKIERILTITQANGDAFMAQMKNMMATAIPSTLPPEQKLKMQEANQKILDLAMKTETEKIRPLYVDLYDEAFSDQEIDGILAFYESAAGRAMIAKQPLIVSKMMAVMMAAMIPEIQRLAKEAASK